MSNIMIDILVFLLLILFFYGVRTVSPVSALDTEGYLSLETGKYYRGFFAIVVVLHHLALGTEAGIAFRYFKPVGNLAVAFFFFLSGYGLQRSYITKGDSYRKGFLLRRIPAVLIPYIIITFLYWVMYLVFGEFYSLKDIVISIVKGSPIASHSWYIINILFFYPVYWLLMRVFGKRYDMMIIGGGIWYVLYALFCIRMEYGDLWYNASHLLIVGMAWATYESRILEFLKKTYMIVAPVVWIAFLAVFCCRENIAALIDVPHIPTIVAFFTAILFTLSVLMFALKIRIGNKALGFLGEISLEIYISQGIFMQSLRNESIYIENDLLWCAAVLAGTVIASWLLHMAFRRILNKKKAAAF